MLYALLHFPKRNVPGPAIEELSLLGLCDLNTITHFHINHFVFGHGDNAASRRYAEIRRHPQCYIHHTRRQCFVLERRTPKSSQYTHRCQRPEHFRNTMVTDNKESVLITGANVGVGLEIARLLLRKHGDRFYIFVGCRTKSKGEAAVKALHDEGLLGCEVIHIEVTSDDSIAKAAETVEEKFGKLDVLIVNVHSLQSPFITMPR